MTDRTLDTLRIAHAPAPLRRLGAALALVALFAATFVAARWVIGVLVPGSAL